MKIIVAMMFQVIFTIELNSDSFSENMAVAPLRCVPSCEIDINNDGISDVVLLSETSRGRELIVLMRSEREYTAFTVSMGKSDMQLSCRFGKTVAATSSGKGDAAGRIYKTPGSYIELWLPEGSSVAYFWNGNGFEEVWISD